MKEILPLLTLIGATNGLFLSVYLSFQKGLSVQGKLLITTLLIWCFVSLMFALRKILPDEQYLIFASLGSSITTFIYPTFYLFLETGVNKMFKLKKNVFLHFIVPSVFFLVTLPIIYWDFSLLFTGELIENTPYIKKVNLFQDYFNATIGIVYLIYFASKHLNKNALHLKWWKTRTGVYTSIALLYLFVHNFGAYGVLAKSYDLPLSNIGFPVYYLSFSATIYLIFHWVISNKIEVFINKEEIILQEKERVTEGKLKEDLDKIIRYIENEKPFLSNEITLTSLAQEVMLNRSRVSFVINEGLKMNFNEMISHYRIVEAKRILLTEEGRSMKLEVLAKASGFNSKTTFNRAFKDIVEMTPSEYKKWIEKEEFSY
ncbi:helix-turn-helix transcriptional regulator [Flammeovirga sp. MY04]|uniref:helix-turn-helix domain-containing protein n=1 Tax=Flammeovirga sp. MY04 TaxID=1191459 RepID=UPI0008061DC8|nr:AraC family transcriptional regulator [Flammeovirga sp. MY04]ANQ52839.1 helix-turn-helix transcriptional regulator [Flammeovirga sp. MY04]